MRRHKTIFGIVIIVVLLAGIAAYLNERSTERILDWKVTDVSKRFQYSINGQMEPNCLELKICVTNLTSSEICIDWNRDESEFQLNGLWVKNQETAGRAHIDPFDSITISVTAPQNTQALYYRMNYEDGPLWSTLDDFFQRHQINLSDKIFEVLMNCDRKIPAHWKQLDINVKMSDLDKTNLVNNRL